MTAHDHTRAKSVNSTHRDHSQRDAADDRDGRAEPPLTYRPDVFPVVQLLTNRHGCVSCYLIAAKCGWRLEETRRILEQLQQENYIQLVDAGEDQVAHLTERGEWLARDATRPDDG